MDNIPYGHCHCGCGRKTRLSPYSYAKKEWVKGEPRFYLKGHNPPAPYSKTPIPVPDEKSCSGCGQVLPNTREYFGERKTGRGGLNSKCKLCLRERSRIWREAHREQVRTAQQKYREQNPERVQETKRKHYEANRAAWLLYVRNRRAAIANAVGEHTLEDVEQMYSDQQGCCAYCECPLNGAYHVDHMVPVSRGGRNDWQNLAVVCDYCNLSKHVRTVEEFFAGRRDDTAGRGSAHPRGFESRHTYTATC